MKKQEALFFALCAGAMAFAVVFILPVFVHQPVAWYYPTEHRWELAEKPKGLAMDFYGRTLQAAIAWAVTVMLTLAVARRLRSASAKVIGLFTAWTLTVAVFVMMHFAWTLHFRVLTPPPVPSWYEPR